MKPTSILDQRFKYVPSEKTDLAKTFARIRREQAKAEAEKKNATVTPIKRRQK